MSMNKSNDNDWFRIALNNPGGTHWEGSCWYVHYLCRYDFPLQFDIPVTYPSTALEIELPSLDGKTPVIEHPSLERSHLLFLSLISFPHTPF